jgi:hypothetical protein
MLPLVSVSFSVVSIGSSAISAARTTTRTKTTTSSTTTTALYGLFDGVKDAFSAPTLERSKIDAERETPIDRWMGWSVASENKKGQQQSKAIGTFFRLLPANNSGVLDHHHDGLCLATFPTH